MHFPAMVSVCLSYSIMALSWSLLLHSMKLQTRTRQHPGAKSPWLINLESLTYESETPVQNLAIADSTSCKTLSRSMALCGITHSYQLCTAQQGP